MKLSNFKKKSDVKRLVEIYGLEPELWEIKEASIIIGGALLPFAVYVLAAYAVGSYWGSCLAIGSLPISALVMTYGGNMYLKEFLSKRKKVKDYYKNPMVANIDDVLSDDVKRIAKYFDYDLSNFSERELSDKVAKLNALKIRRDAKDITRYEYKEAVKQLEK